MKDFNFWLGLPYILQGCIPEMQPHVSTLKQELELLEDKIRDAKTTIIALMKQNSPISPEIKEKIKNDYKILLSELEMKKNKIIALSINSTLGNLKVLYDKLEKNEKITLESMNLAFKISRAIVEKSIEEFQACLNEGEKKLFLMLKVYGEKCLEKFVEKINERILMENIEGDSDGDLESEFLDEENIDGSTVCTINSPFSNERSFINREDIFDIL